MNPYARQLGSRDPLKVVATTARHLEQLSAALGPVRILEPTAPGKWSPHEILCHLADCEVVFSYRLRQALAEDHHILQTFDQDLFAQNYATYETEAAIMTFACLRQWNLMLLRAAIPQALNKPVHHPELGELNFGELVEIMAGHDLNHRAQLESVALQTPLNR